MAVKDHAVEDAHLDHSSDGSHDDKRIIANYDQATLNVPGRGQAATDKFGRPLIAIDPVAERKLRLKLDLFIVPPVAILYLFCFIDRANIGNAKLAGLEKDLNLKGYDYNKVISTFYIAYILFEIPSTTACKIIGPGRFIPAVTLGFGLCSIFTGLCNNIHSASGVRFLLGVFEAGMMPSIAYYLSRWFKRSELAFRLSLYIVMAPLAGAFGGLLASAILNLDHFGGLHKWRMIFAIEGIITCGLAVIGYFVMTDRPDTARWLTQEEKDLAINRIKVERVGTTEVLDKLDWKKIRRGIFSPVTLATAFMFLLNNITIQGLAFFAPEIVKTIYPTESIVRVQLHTVPPYVVGAFFTVLFPLISWYIDKRQILMIIATPMWICGYIMFLASNNPQVRYGATFLIASGAFSYGAFCNAQVSANVISDTARASAISTNVLLGNTGGLIATWSFLPSDAPDFHIGNGLNLAVASMTLIIGVCLLFYMKWDNRRREKVDVDEALAGMTEKQIQDLDWRHPAFRWRP